MMPRTMRTTVTLDPDVAARLLRLSSERRTSFKETINSVLRQGLDPGSRGGASYQEQTAALGARPGVDLTKALQVAAQLEDEVAVRELELRK
jgi:hypothetical protein